MTSYQININDTPTDVTAFMWSKPGGLGSSTASATPVKSDDVWYLNRVVVRRDDRRQGIGSLLIESLKLILRRRGAKKLLVEPSGYDTSQEEKIQFFMACGFKIVGNPDEPCGDWHMAFVF